MNIKNIKFSPKTLKNLEKQMKEERENNANCRSFMVGGIGKDFKSLIRSPIKRVWRCDPKCNNPLHRD